MWARGLKLAASFLLLLGRQSRPVWARGLKLFGIFQCTNLSVAPRVGAWIETYGSKADAKFAGSRPVWARGLKHHKSV